MANEVQRKETQTMPRFSPSTDIIEKEDGFHIYMDMPGVAREQLNINLQDTDLEISAQAEFPKLENASNIHMEFGTCEYVRSFTISDVVDRENIKATMKNGVLELYLPKADKARPRKIEIEAG